MLKQRLRIIHEKKGKSRKIESNELLKSKRYFVEQFDGHLKANVLDECWLWPRVWLKRRLRLLLS